MFIGHLLSFSKVVLGESLGPGDIAVDATAGNGLDTLFLSRSVGPSGRVYAFDVQEEALKNTRRRLEREQAPDNVYLLASGHEHMARHLPPEAHGTVAAVMFNLGYLPGSDEQVVTRPDTTITALDAALDLLRPRGIISMVVYTGHPGGPEEAELLAEHIRSLPPARVRALHVCAMNDASMKKHVVLLQRCG